MVSDLFPSRTPPLAEVRPHLTASRAEAGAEAVLRSGRIASPSCSEGSAGKAACGCEAEGRGQCPVWGAKITDPPVVVQDCRFPLGSKQSANRGLIRNKCYDMRLSLHVSLGLFCFSFFP